MDSLFSQGCSHQVSFGYFIVPCQLELYSRAGLCMARRHIAALYEVAHGAGNLQASDVSTYLLQRAFRQQRFGTQNERGVSFWQLRCWHVGGLQLGSDRTELGRAESRYVDCDHAPNGSHDLRNLIYLSISYIPRLKIVAKDSQAPNKCLYS